MPVAIVTGGSRGFGRALVLDLASDGWGVVFDGRRASDVEHVKNELRDRHDRVTALAGDVTDPAHREALVRAASALGSLDLLVNNASTLGPTPLARLDAYPLDAFRTVFELNVLAPLALVQLALPALRASRGTVVALSSDAAIEGYETWGAYGSSKAALDQLQAVLGAEEHALRVYAFDPGDMRTDMHQAAFAGENILDRPLPESVVPRFRALLDSGAPSGRYRAQEFAT